ncbi:cupin domain-containing protein [Pseudomonas brassicacearum]|uniref:cupin domain-containing protein n=1 Tax=Pseudomonas brassicacearum TaxID=930166 RepID=UPI0009B66F50|nr:cupin domain-containing protein [Pseudomonas brassicacearum]
MNDKYLHRVVGFTHSEIEPTRDIINHSGVVSGQYESMTWMHYSDEERRITSGHWEAGACREKFHSEQTEFCHILTGIVRLTNQNGSTDEFKEGESFIIPAGFSGIWENVGTVKKIFVIA